MRVPGLLLASLFLLEGCYYIQAARGQLDLLHRRRPVEEVIADPSSPEQLRLRLQTVREARNFAVTALMLPDNESYRSYADLERDYVVWNVFAAPEFSVEPKLWCYPIAGCVAYRGYFSEKAAQKQAARLGSKGFDTVVGGVPAYSTLGRFADPVLSTMMRWSDDDLVSTLFHELAHQKLYVKDDTEFNESFATAVAEVGLQRWRTFRDESAQSTLVTGRRAESKAILELAIATRNQLQMLYASGLDEQSMRERKRQMFKALADDVQRLTEKSGYDVNWFSGPLNNARLASIGLYEGRLEAFNSILRHCDSDLECFYRKSAALAEMSKKARDTELDRLGSEVR
jgi:predicted aminopeptidase